MLQEIQGGQAVVKVDVEYEACFRKCRRFDQAVQDVKGGCWSMR